ncbi:Dual specificity phosphatase [Brachionus plicatilis]|uniref:protein-tyrosine-phosphatase n=1 Tax=Brachionus plicatilis TaxID=10195 RepID=A0A3M7PX87_BRAPC|nr:Dual specificity phosphatase [Brachionus plicatilis]
MLSANSSSIIEPYLHLGDSYLNSNPHLAPVFGYTHVLNITSEISPNWLLLLMLKKYKQIPADDNFYYNIRLNFEEAFQMIDEARQTNGKILVHCAMGISRSATIVIGYLMSRYKMSLFSAYNHVKSKRSQINPNKHFMRTLEIYEKELSGNYIRAQLISTANQRPSYTFVFRPELHSIRFPKIKNF